MVAGGHTHVQALGHALHSWLQSVLFTPFGVKWWTTYIFQERLCWMQINLLCLIMDTSLRLKSKQELWPGFAIPPLLCKDCLWKDPLPSIKCPPLTFSIRAGTRQMRAMKTRGQVTEDWREQTFRLRENNGDRRGLWPAGRAVAPSKSSCLTPAHHGTEGHTPGLPLLQHAVLETASCLSETAWFLKWY